MSKVFAVLTVAAGLFVAYGSLFAHHSNTIYDMQNTITVQGTVSAVEFINPHVQVRFDVKGEQGNIEKWVGVTGPPNALRRSGITRNTLKPGDQITVDGHRAKDGGTVIEIEKIVLSDGTSFSL